MQGLWQGLCTNRQEGQRCSNATSADEHAEVAEHNFAELLEGAQGCKPTPSQQQDCEAGVFGHNE